MKKTKLNILYLFTILSFADNANAMLSSKIAQMKSTSKIGYSRLYSSSKSSKFNIADATKGILGGSAGAAGGVLAGSIASLLVAALIIPPTHLIGEEITIKDIDTVTIPVGAVMGSFIGAGLSGGIQGIGAYGVFIGTAYAIGKYRNKKSN